MPEPSLFSLDAMGVDPLMNPAATLTGERWRIGLLTDRLVRFEWSETGRFVDEASQMAINRRFPTPRFSTREADGLLIIETDGLIIRYDRGPFRPGGLSVSVKGATNQDNTWHYGDSQAKNLHGTTRTLDETDGPAELGVGLVSKTGWAVLDDSDSALIVKTDCVRGSDNPFGTWVAPREGGGIDLYFFGYGTCAADAVRDFAHLAGPVPLLPRWALGNWWSRYHSYTDAEYRALMERFDAEGLPFTVAVIDMGWHLVDEVDPKYGSGWTGYTWNRDLIPDPPAFLDWLHSRGLATALSDHPRDGVRAFEERYGAVARAVGVDPASGDAVDFDATSPTFMAAYFDQLHHPIEDEGVDLWWMDWQQGTVAREDWLDPLWMLNHLHFLDSARRGERPMTFSRYAGPGSHRYPIGFSGDTVVSWKSLKFQPYFTAMAANIGYGWWSHDIGGHMFGRRDEALQARWYQLGAFSPIMRLHSSDSPFNSKEPWRFHPETRQAMNEALRLRHALIPYLYAMNRRAAVESLPLVEPMYWRYSGGNVPTEYLFGSELVVSPIVEPQDAECQRGKADVWLPQGVWFDFFDGRRYCAPAASGRLMQAWRALTRIPVFAPAGGIVPMQALDGENGRLNAVDNPVHLEIIAFPGADGNFDLWEDDGGAGEHNRWARTGLSLRWHDGGRDGGCADPTVSRFVIAPVEGAADVVPGLRHWTLRLRGVAELDASRVRVTIDDGAAADGAAGDGRAGAESVTDVAVSYDSATLTLTVDLPVLPVSARVEIALEGCRVADDPTLADAFEVLYDAQMEYFTKERALALIRDCGSDALAALRSLEAEPGEYGEPQWFVSHMPEGVIGALTEVLTRASGNRA